MIKYLFKEPLVVFVVLAGAIFALFQQLSTNYQPDNAEIVITDGHLRALETGFEKVWQRSPTEDELEGLVNNYIREEILYREALAMGLDKDDGIVRRRLRQKIEFISEDLASLNQPEEQDLQDYLESHQEVYRQDNRYTFQQIYFNTSKRGATAQADAVSVLQTLHEREDDTHEIESLGDPLMIQQHFLNDTENAIERALGSQFTQSLDKLLIGRWSGPIKSGFGLHLVYIDKRFEGALPEVDELRDVLIRDWASEQRKKANEALYDTLRKRYKVTLEYSLANKPLNESSVSVDVVQVSMNEAVQ